MFYNYNNTVYDTDRQFGIRWRVKATKGEMLRVHWVLTDKLIWRVALFWMVVFDGSLFLCSCQLRFSPDCDPSARWSVARPGHRDAANLTEDSRILAWWHEAKVTCEDLTTAQNSHHYSHTRRNFLFLTCTTCTTRKYLIAAFKQLGHRNYKKHFVYLPGILPWG